MTDASLAPAAGRGGARRAPGRWRVYDVAVKGYGTAPIPEASRGRALAAAWRSDAFTHLSFKDFLRLATAKLRKGAPVPDGYDYVRASHGLDIRLGSAVTLVAEGQSHDGLEGEVVYPGTSSTAHVRVFVQGRRHPLIVHPSEVVPLIPG